MKKHLTTVDLDGFEFEVHGVWHEAQPGAQLDPPEGGYIDDAEIRLDGKDISDLLHDRAWDEILVEAERKLS